jgi:hypothetical protein
MLRDKCFCAEDPTILLGVEGLTAVAMQSSLFRNITPVAFGKSTNVSEEYFASIFRVKYS